MGGALRRLGHVQGPVRENLGMVWESGWFGRVCARGRCWARILGGGLGVWGVVMLGMRYLLLSQRWKRVRKYVVVVVVVARMGVVGDMLCSQSVVRRWRGLRWRLRQSRRWMCRPLLGSGKVVRNS
jgi:hypothetical protein